MAARGFSMRTGGSVTGPEIGLKIASSVSSAFRRSSGRFQTKTSSFPVAGNAGSQRSDMTTPAIQVASRGALIARASQSRAKPESPCSASSSSAMIRHIRAVGRSLPWIWGSMEFARGFVVAGGNRGAGHRNAAFRIARCELDECARSCQTLGVRFTRTQIEVNLREVRMRRQRPRRLDHFRRFPGTALAGQEPRGERDRWHKIRRTFDRRARKTECFVRLGLLLIKSDRCRKHGALTVPCRPVDQIPVVIERRQGAFPILCRDMLFKNRGCRPRQRCDPMRPMGKIMCRIDIPAPMRMRVKAAETEQPRVVAPGHFRKCGFHRMVIAGELGGLGPEQQSQRLSRQVTLRLGGGFYGEPRVPRAHGDDAARKGGIALVAAARPIRAGNRWAAIARQNGSRSITT